MIYYLYTEKLKCNLRIVDLYTRNNQMHTSSFSFKFGQGRQNENFVKHEIFFSLFSHN